MPLTTENAAPERARLGSRLGSRIREAVTHPLAHPGALGLTGSLLLSLGAFGVGYIPPRSRVGVLTASDILRGSTVGSVIARLLVIAGVLMLLWAWLQVGRNVRAGLITGTHWLTRTFWVWALPLMVAPPLFSQDVYSYTAQGNLAATGYDPYQFGPASIPGTNLEAVSPVWLETPAPYGPLFLFASKISAEVFGGQVYLAALFMRLLAVLGVVLIAVYLPRLARACGVDPPLAVWAGLLNPLVLMHFVSGAHNDAIMVGLVAAGLTYALEGRPIVGALVITLGGTVKAPALLALGFVGLAWAQQRAGRPDPRRRERILPWVGVALASLAAFLAINRLTGLDFGWIGALGTPGMIHTWMSPMTAVSLTTGHVISLAGFGDHTDGIMEALRWIGEGIVLALIAWWLLRRRAIAPALGAGAALLLLAVFGPVLQPWYVLWGLVVLAGAGLGRRGVPYLVAVTGALVAYSLVQPSATMRPFLHLSDWACSLVAVTVGVAILMRDPETRADILGRLRMPDTSS